MRVVERNSPSFNISRGSAGVAVLVIGIEDGITLATLIFSDYLKIPLYGVATL